MYLNRSDLNHLPCVTYIYVYILPFLQFNPCNYNSLNVKRNRIMLIDLFVIAVLNIHSYSDIEKDMSLYIILEYIFVQYKRDQVKIDARKRTEER